ncbi:hypothetical protein [Sphingomonas sp. TZW2008]|uniref:hypothetical protein n=1 Tax=Sphingomonas sp. TZW2008 TaxID=1917973 RepID=UPI000A270BE8|nr:hypothetical protein [Sphingomonas sp. TZW2008]
MTFQTLGRPMWVGRAREELRQRLTLLAGVDPNTGYRLDDDVDFYQANSTPDEDADRLAHLATFRAQAVSYIAGVLDVNTLRAWRQGDDGRLEVVGPTWAGQRFFEANGAPPELMIDQGEWAIWLAAFGQANVGPRKRGGRPSSYAWKAFEAYAVERLDHEGGFSEGWKKADLEREMAMWCDQFWEKTPSESQIRDHINIAELAFQKMRAEM